MSKVSGILGLSLCCHVKLVLVVSEGFLMLLTQNHRRLFRLKMDIFQETSELGQLRITLLVDFKLRTKGSIVIKQKF